VRELYFATYTYKKTEKIGILNKSQTKVLGLDEISIVKTFDNMLSLIEELNDETIKLIKKALEDSDLWEEKGIDIRKVKIIAPIPRLNRNVICLGLNYKDHVAESQSALTLKVTEPEFPVFFTKMPSDAIGTGENINSHPQVTNEVDYEVELAIIIGKKGINIKPEEVEKYSLALQYLNVLYLNQQLLCINQALTLK